jgi:hypothetical protein
MSKSELKTKVNDASVSMFLGSIKDEKQRMETMALYTMLQKATKEAPKMWGSSIVGFGSYHYLGKSGREGDWFLAGISPRKQAITLYMCGGWEGNESLLEKLGKYSLGVGCLYIKRLDDIDLKVMKRLIDESLKRARKIVKEDAKRQSALKKK